MKAKILNKKSYFSEDQRLSIAIEQNPAAMVITDLGGNIEYSNAKFTELTGYTAEEAFGMNSSALKSGKTDPKVYKELWSTILNGKTWRGEFINRKKTGDEYIENAVIAPIFDNAGNTINYLALYDDITEQRKAEAKVLEQQAELEKSYRELEQEKKNAEAAFAETEKLNEFTRIINSTIDTSTILKEIYTYICERTGFDIVWILLINKKKNQVFSDPTLSIFGSPEKLDFDYFSHFRKKINESLGVIFQTYKTRVPFYFSNAFSFKRRVRNLFDNQQYRLRRTDFEIQRKGNLQSMLQIPLILQDEVIGILNLTVQDKIIEIQNEDIKKLMRFADQIAGVIFNAHLVEEMQEAKRDAEIAEKIALMAQKEMVTGIHPCGENDAGAECALSVPAECSVCIVELIRKFLVAAPVVLVQLRHDVDIDASRCEMFVDPCRDIFLHGILCDQFLELLLHGRKVRKHIDVLLHLFAGLMDGAFHVLELLVHDLVHQIEIRGDPFGAVVRAVLFRDGRERNIQFSAVELPHLFHKDIIHKGHHRRDAVVGDLHRRIDRKTDAHDGNMERMLLILHGTL
jgi:PAS domain S-box-containing protein